MQAAVRRRADLAARARRSPRSTTARRSLKLERKDGSVLDCMTMPLPDGATMLTFQDITDTENVERRCANATRR